MKRESVNYFVVGLFVLLGLGALLVTFYRLSGAGGQTDRYYTQYRNVAGVTAGTQVTYEGYVIGHIAEIEPQRDTSGIQYRLALNLKKGWSIPDDSSASVYADGLLADTVINIREGRSKTYLQPGDDINGKPTVDLFAALGAVAGEFGDLTQSSIKPLMETLRQTIVRIGGDIETQLPAILARVNSMTEKLDRSATHVAAIVDARTENQARRILDNTDRAAEAFAYLSKNLLSVQSDITHLITELDGLVSESRPDIQKSLLDLRDTLEQVSNSSGDILMNLDNASRNVNEFTRQIRQNPTTLLKSRAPTDKARYD